MTIDAKLDGKVALVTGATGGIGKEIARGLARLGATVVIGARNPEKGQAVQKELAADTGSGRLSVMQLDVADPSSIRAFAEAFGRTHPRMHILVNNAGAWFTDRRENPDGLELTFATNVLGPYLLTQLLEGPLKAAAPARVVNIVSGIAANYDANDLMWRARKYDGFKAYAQSKQALRMLTWRQAERFAGTGVTVNAAAPGFVRTDFNQNARGFVPAMINFMVKLFGVTPAEGADTPLWVAASPELEQVSGKFFDGRKEKDGKFREAAAIADLERRLDELLAQPARAKAG
jgi:NAD(P)-dependent dehydrogenase (short-subunit alcohol dehydrogenase family)